MWKTKTYKYHIRNQREKLSGIGVFVFFNSEIYEFRFWNLRISILKFTNFVSEIYEFQFWNLRISFLKFSIFNSEILRFQFWGTRFESRKRRKVLGEFFGWMFLVNFLGRFYFWELLGIFHLNLFFVTCCDLSFLGWIFLLAFWLAKIQDGLSVIDV